MQSCQVTVQQQQQQIEFHGVRPVYPLTGELVNCYFALPAQCRPEVGDWIGIYPANWSNLVGHCLVKKTIRPENIWFTPAGQQYGKVEFDAECLMQQICPGKQQQYQFVYVKNGECIRGQSTPFMFVQQQQQGGLIVDEMIPSSVFSGKPEWSYNGINTTTIRPLTTVTGTTVTGTTTVTCPTTTATTLEQVVEREMEKLQTGIFGLEQGLVGGQYIRQQQPITTGITGLTTVYPTTTLFEQQQQQQQQQWGRIATPFGIPTNSTTTTTTVTGLTTGTPLATPVEIMCELAGQQQPHQIRKQWQSRIGEVQQVLAEQIRLEQAQRRIEQLAMHIQLKQYERHIQHVQRRQEEINDYLRVKMQQQVVDFEQKVYNIVKLGEQYAQQQPEQYVRRYEQLLKEKVELEIQKRIAIFHKLRQTIKECERKLREIQWAEQQHLNKYHQVLKTRLGQFETRYVVAPSQQWYNVEKVEMELREQLRQLVAQFVGEQRREQFDLIVKSQNQMQYLCQEIQSRLIECQYPELYTQYRIPVIPSMTAGSWTTSTGIYGQQYVPALFCYYPQYEQHYSQMQQFEQQLRELKQTLRQRMLIGGAQQQQRPEFYQTVFGGQMFGEWIKPVGEQLRELDMQLREEKRMIMQQQQQQQIVESIVRPCVQPVQWFERRIQSLAQHMRFFAQQQQQQQQQQYEECRLREVLSQLKALECELYEYPQFYQQYSAGKFAQSQQVIALCQYLQTLVREKVAQLNSIVYEQQLPLAECFVFPTTVLGQQQQQHYSVVAGAWKRMIQFERKLVQLKAMIVERQHYQLVQQRLAELEQVHSTVYAQLPVYKQEKCQEQLRQLRQMLNECFEQLPTVYQQCQWFNLAEQQQPQWIAGQQQQWVGQQWPQHWTVQPELFVQHQEKCERLWQLVHELECQILNVEQQQQINKMLVGRELCGFSLCQQRFERMIQEFQQRIMCQQPFGTTGVRGVIAEIEQIAKQLYIQQQQQQQQFNHTVYGQQLREQIAQFETILCERQTELFQQWFVQPHQQQYVRQLLRQIRELKQEIVELLCVEQQQQQQQPPKVVIKRECSMPSIVERELEREVLEKLLGCAAEQKPITGRRGDRRQFVLPRSASMFSSRLIDLESESEDESDDEECQVESICFPISTTVYEPRIKSLVGVEGLIGDLESELIKMRLPKECTGITARRVVLSGKPESVCEEISKMVGESLLTTVMPTIVKLATIGQKPEQEERVKEIKTTMFVEPTPFGTTKCVKVQQKRETTEF